MDRRIRTLLLSALLFVVITPAAEAGFADKLLPTVDASKGVSVSANARNVRITFGPKAAKLYRKLAGENARVGCGDPSVRSTGNIRVSSGSDIPTVTRSGGLWWVERKLPRRRGTVSFHRAGSADLCFLTTDDRRSDNGCMPFVSSDCVRLLVALNDAGRASIDSFARAIELDLAFATPFEELREEVGANAIVALPAPDAAPAPGQVGVFDDGTTRTVAALLAGGQRLFVTRSAGVFSTNVPALSGPFPIRGLL
jgi:hypothetical protein